MAKNFLSFVIWASCLMGLQAEPYPGGVAAPSVWFQTAPVGDDKNGEHHWVDRAADQSRIYKKGTEIEASAPRSDIHTYNFNPAMPFDSTVNHEFTVKGTNLTQKTVVAVVGAKKQEASEDAFLYHIKAKADQGRVLSKTKVIRTSAEDKSVYTYKYLLTERDTAERVKVLSFLEAQKPDRSIWKSGRLSKVNLGGKFEKAWTVGDSSLAEVSDSLSARRFYMPELAIYSRYLRPGERLRVESYLALKYGITLSTHYISSNGNLLWNDKEYKYRVVGYGRDDKSAFFQEQSTTSYEEHAFDVDDTYHRGDSQLGSSSKNLITMGFMQATDIPDSSYVVFADNGSPTQTKPIENKKDSIDYTDSMKVLSRTWKVRTLGIDSTYMHRLELGYEMLTDTAFALYRNDNAYLLIDQSGSGSFKSKVDTIRMTELDEERKKMIFENFTLAPICHFTFSYSGVPLQKEGTEKYEYFLEMRDPSCNGYVNNEDGYVKLLLPQSETGYYYDFKDSYTGGTNIRTAFDSIEIDNVASNNYYLTVMPANCNTLDFEGTGITLTNVQFLNNGGSITWPLSDTQTESKVAFVNILENNPQEGSLRYGVKIAGGKMFIIENHIVGNNAVADVNDGDVIRIERMSQTAIHIFRNNILVRAINITNDCTFKFGVKTTDGNVRNLSLEQFNWGRGNFPDFFFDEYQLAGAFAYSNEDLSVYPTGYMRYYIDFNIRCWENNGATSSNETVQIYTDQSNRTFTASLSLSHATDVTFFVYSLNNILLFEDNTYAYNGTASKTFSVNHPGEYIIVAVTGDGKTYENRTVLR